MDCPTDCPPARLPLDVLLGDPYTFIASFLALDRAQASVETLSLFGTLYGPPFHDLLGPERRFRHGRHITKLLLRTDARSREPLYRE